MSIIHDALKKLQGQTPKADETPTVQAPAQPSSSTYLYSTPTEPVIDQPAEQKSSIPNKIKSALALICALAITIGALGFFYKQLNTYFPSVKRSIKSSFYKLIHKQELPDFKTKSPADLIPLAKLTVTPPVPITNIPAAPATTIKPAAPEILNIHGVMSNGASNLVLINDQVYQEGDEVDGIKIIKISLKSITVIDKGKEEEIRVKN